METGYSVILYPIFNGLLQYEPRGLHILSGLDRKLIHRAILRVYTEAVKVISRY